MRRSLVIAGTAITAAALPSAHAFAQGSAVQTHSSCATAMGAAGVASPCRDGSAVLFNPGALAMQSSVIGIGTTAITSSGGFTYDFTGEEVTRDSKRSQVPFGFASFKINDRFAAGIGGFAPYGLRIDWPESFEGRYVSYESQLKNIYIQPTIAARLGERVTLGVGVDYVRASIDLNRFIDLSTTPTTTPGVTFGTLGILPNTDFARANLSGDGSGVTFNVGGTVNLTPKVDLGVRYMHSVDIDYDGDAVFTQVNTNVVLPAGNPISAKAGLQGPLPLDPFLTSQLFGTGKPLGNQAIATTLTLPSQFVAGLAYRPNDWVKLLFDYQRTGWAAFDSAQIDFAGGATDQPLILDYQNTNTYRFGGDVAATPKLNLRAGFIFNTAAEKAASVSPLLPEAERNYYSAGLGYKFGNALALDVGYQYVDQADRRGRTGGRTSTSQTAQQLNNGVYNSNAHVLNATISYHFGHAQP